jgi:hypothetical protein
VEMMNLTREHRLWLDMIIAAQLYLEELSEDNIQEFYGSDYYKALKDYIREVKYTGIEEV